MALVIMRQASGGERERAAMTDVCSKRCGARDFRKSGIVSRPSAYCCHGCGCNFIMPPSRGKQLAMRALASLLYAMGNMTSA